MSYPPTSKITKSGGFLYLNPTDLGAGEYGTNLGYTEKGVFLTPLIQTVELTQMETGSKAVMSIHVGTNYLVSTTLISYDESAISVCFPSMYSGSTISLPGNLTPGTDLFTAHTHSFLFLPDDVEHNPAIHITGGISLLNHSGVVHFHHTREMGFLCNIYGGSVRVGTIADLD